MAYRRACVSPQDRCAEDSVSPGGMPSATLAPSPLAAGSCASPWTDAQRIAHRYRWHVIWPRTAVFVRTPRSPQRHDLARHPRTDVQRIGIATVSDWGTSNRPPLPSPAELQVSPHFLLLACCMQEGRSRFPLAGGAPWKGTTGRRGAACRAAYGSHASSARRFLVPCTLASRR